MIKNYWLLNLIWVTANVLSPISMAQSTEKNIESNMTTSAISAASVNKIIVETAAINVNNGVYQVSAKIQYPKNEEINNTLRDGVSLAYDIHVEVAEAKNYWFDNTVISITLRRVLSFHAVSERYLVKDTTTGDQTSYSSLEDAVVFLGKIEAWPIMVSAQISEPGEYTVRLRASQYRRHLTGALRALLFWTNNWSRDSGWYSWPLIR